MVEIGEDGVPTNKLTGEALETSKRIGSDATTTEEAMTCDKWKKYLDDGVAVANDKTTSRAQRVAKWSILSKDFSESTGELTPTLKLKRSVASELHSKVIEAMYA
jgi:long-subunit acyl-CoA synthetase (AMP-forming)